MRHLRANINAVGRVDTVEVLAEALPAPRDAGVERRAGNIFDGLHEFDEGGLGAATHRREADAAVPHHHGRDTVPAARSDLFVPAHLTVVVGVDVDKTRGEQVAIGVDDTLGIPANTALCGTAYRDNFAGNDCDITRESVRARAVDYLCISNDQVVHVDLLAIKLIVGWMSGVAALSASGRRTQTADNALRAHPPYELADETHLRSGPLRNKVPERAPVCSPDSMNTWPFTSV